MSDSQQLAALDAKARHYLVLKTSKVPARVWQKALTIIAFYTANAAALFVRGIPDDIQLAYLLEHYDDLRACGFRVIRTLSDYNLLRALWYWQIDESHSFSHKHASVRYNIYTMALVCGAEGKVDWCDKAAVDCAWTFLRAWMGAMQQRDTDNQEEFLALCKGGLDLMVFSSSQKQLMKKRVKTLQIKVLSKLIAPEDWSVKGKELDVKTIMEHGPGMALKWCLSLEVLTSALVPDDGDEEVGDDMDVDVDLAAVDWTWPPLKALMTDPDEHVTVATMLLKDETTF